MKKDNLDWEYKHKDLFPEDDVLITDDHILKHYFETRTAKEFNEKAIIEVWECFKEYLGKQLKDKSIRRLQLNRFCTLQKKAPKEADRGKFLNDPTHTMWFLDLVLKNDRAVIMCEKYYEEIYGGLSYEEIEEKANENIMENTLFKIKKERRIKRNR